MPSGASISPRPDSPADRTAVVLAGGTGRRLGGVDKATLSLGGTTVLGSLLDGLDADMPVVVAGDEQPTSRPVTFCRENPPGGGPAAGLGAALPFVQTPLTGVVAVDMPWAAPVLRSALDLLEHHVEVDAVVPVDTSGHHQYLCTAWRTESLRRIVNELGDLHGRAMREIVSSANIVELALPDGDARLHDIDTPEDLRRAREDIART
jgi:molybdopterin-guanine dinucleotide biosynthesis protein A